MEYKWFRCFHSHSAYTSKAFFHSRQSFLLKKLLELSFNELGLKYLTFSRYFSISSSLLQALLPTPARKAAPYRDELEQMSLRSTTFSRIFARYWQKKSLCATPPVTLNNKNNFVKRKIISLKEKYFLVFKILRYLLHRS